MPHLFTQKELDDARAKRANWRSVVWSHHMQKRWRVFTQTVKHAMWVKNYNEFVKEFQNLHNSRLVKKVMAELGEEARVIKVMDGLAEVAVEEARNKVKRPRYAKA